MIRHALLFISLSILSLLGGCANLGANEPPPSQVAQDVLLQLQEQYSAGHYGVVIRTVATSDDIATAPTSLRIEAYKLQAFSYCVRNFPHLCEETFLRILQINPDFNLAPTEAGHPQWSPAFNAAHTRFKTHSIKFTKQSGY